MVTCKGIVRKNSDMSASFELTQMWQQSGNRCCYARLLAFLSGHRLQSQSTVLKSSELDQEYLKITMQLKEILN